MHDAWTLFLGIKQPLGLHVAAVQSNKHMAIAKEAII